MASEFIHQTLALTHNSDSTNDEDPKRLQETPTGSSSSASGRKVRGRPPGSKNKPKPPVIITKDSDSAMHPMFLEVAANSDILDATFSFSRFRRLGISVISATGAVSNLSIRHPTLRSSSIALSGRFEILSLSGTFLPDSTSSRSSAFAISVAGAQGQVIGGTVVGGLTAAGTVVLTAAGFLVPEFHRLPVVVVEGGHQEEEPNQQQQQRDQQEDQSLVGPTAVTTSCSQHQQVQEMVLWGTPTPAPAMRAIPPHSHRAPPPQSQHHY